MLEKIQNKINEEVEKILKKKVPWHNHTFQQPTLMFSQFMISEMTSGSGICQLMTSWANGLQLCLGHTSPPVGH